MAVKFISNTMRVAPIWLFVTSRKSWMKGEPVGEATRSFRSPREKRSMRAQARPIIPFKTTLPTMARGMFNAGWCISSAMWEVAS